MTSAAEHKPQVMQAEYAAFRDAVTGSFSRLASLASQAGGPDLEEAAQALVKSLSEPFLFVVVGEVKAGKSSFVNALLGAELCAVAPDPCTDVIQKIIYAPQPHMRTVSEHVREVGQPSDILREIVIVDTPGTNSLIRLHQEITESFLPEADLAVFVFPAVNPYARTAWDFLDLVHERWRKKVVFVLQQADRASPEELDVNKARVAELARERGIGEPVLFTVSAKLEKEGSAGSGFGELWEYLRSNVTGGRQYLLKMESLLTTGETLLADVGRALDSHTTALEADRAEQERIERFLTRGRDRALREATLLEARLAESYRRLTRETVDKLSDSLSLGSLIRSSAAGLFGRSKPVKDLAETLLNDFDRRLAQEVESIAAEESRAIAGHLTEVLTDLAEELKSARPKLLRVSDLTKERLAVIDHSLENVLTLLKDASLADRLHPTGLSRMGDQAVMGGFLTAAGAVIAATTSAVAFDVTGGVVSTVGALIAFNTLALKRRSIVKRFEDGLAQGGERFESELRERLAAQVEILADDIRQAFAPFFDSLSDRAAQLEHLRAQLGEVSTALEQQRGNMDRLLSRR